MAKQKVSYLCSNCDYTTVKWIGCCPECNEWNSFVEQIEDTSATKTFSAAKRQSTELYSLDKISSVDKKRITSNIDEWDRVLGGGILPGSFLILTGDPGIGKSTLLLQVANSIAKKEASESSGKVFYFSSEESLQQVKTRASRLKTVSNNVLFSDQSNLDSIIETCKKEKPSLIIIDSIQNCFASTESNSIPGTISQLRESGFALMRFSKENDIATIVTGHITKEGHIAGPKILEHMVDGVFYLQGEDRWSTRILRSVKNRFGNINEIGFFEMNEVGLEEITNINQHLINDFTPSPGSVLICNVEGSRPLILELQALCVTSKFGTPQRIVTGVDYKRISLISAILEKYLHIKLSSQDIFFKVSGGFNIKESSADLGIALALLSSYFQQPIQKKSLAIGEINLAGFVKPTNHISIRIKEAEKFGIEQVFTSRDQKISGEITKQTKPISFKNIYELLKLFPEEDSK